MREREREGGKEGIREVEGKCKHNLKAHMHCGGVHGENDGTLHHKAN